MDHSNYRTEGVISGKHLRVFITVAPCWVRAINSYHHLNRAVTVVLQHIFNHSDNNLPLNCVMIDKMIDRTCLWEHFAHPCVYSPGSLFITMVCKNFKKHVSLVFEAVSHGLPFFCALPSSHNLYHLALIIPLKLCLKALSLPLTCCSLCEENINRPPPLLLWFNWGAIEWLRLKNLQLVLLGKNH